MSKTLTVKVGAVSVEFFPLTLAQMQTLEEELKVLMGGRREGEDYFSPDRVEKMMKIYTASAQRGNPQITIDDVRKVVDIDNVPEVNATVLGQRKKFLAAQSAETELFATPKAPTAPPTVHTTGEQLVGPAGAVFARIANGSVSVDPTGPQTGGGSTQG